MNFPRSTPRSLLFVSSERISFRIFCNHDRNFKRIGGVVRHYHQRQRPRLPFWKKEPLSVLVQPWSHQYGHLRRDLSTEKDKQNPSSSSIRSKKGTNEDQLDKTEDSPHHDGMHFWSNWIRELQSPPNIITTTRILCTPVLSYWVITGHHEWAVVGCIVAAASDYVDGYLAKNYGMSTVLGAFLDPMADKVFINVLAGSLWYTGVLPTPLVALWLARDLALIVGCASYVRYHSENSAHAFDPSVTPLKVNPTLLSKANTALQFTTVGMGIVYPLGVIADPVLTGVCYATGMTTLGSGIQYVLYSAFEDSGNEEKNQSSNSGEGSTSATINNDSSSADDKKKQ
ncbi:Probable cardiolipin synthase (CMP-forming) [Seminavis robusta]|uniref:Probable cardiolipin synthase (CMP-forming) n=1 Tax=Seminavis robusta TaxID=568900 RepID=A0A9N8H3N8_9STRA|nr:Probable cardiolipin synthase (CMP-forming) [Seminavis robusta]|eukprot:Sro43_g025990.1 Probable cardiolipin synthase (CMP-forming) (342) ;mRNA; r:27993-29136